MFIKDLMLRCVLAITDEERREKQDLLINLVPWADLRPALPVIAWRMPWMMPP